jgi:Na+-transporting methylmalonyl-CoA/oxaloacetate decarboxylase gamma subunit
MGIGVVGSVLIVLCAVAVWLAAVFGMTRKDSRSERRARDRAKQALPDSERVRS